MAKAKTSLKPKTPWKKSIRKTHKIGGMNFYEINASEELASNPEKVFEGLAQCLSDGDKEAFQEILEAYVKAKNILQVSKETKLSRTVIYEAINRKKDPRLGTICKIMSAFKKGA